jgi:AAA domain
LEISGKRRKWRQLAQTVLQTPKPSRCFRLNGTKVMALRGRAGTGRTTMMRATLAAIEKTGKRVCDFAPSAEASRGVLQQEGFANAETVERLLIDPEMQWQIKGQVLLVDEAGRMSV